MFDMVRRSARSNTRSSGPPSLLRGSRQRTFGARSHCACGGGCPRCRTGRPAPAKLEISQPGDALEGEADRAAEQVLDTPDVHERRDDHDPNAGAGPRLSRYATGAAQRSVEVPRVVSDILSSPGESLDTATREFMEPRFGHELSHVHIHRDERAGASARAVNARAYTVGAHIVFDHGEYAPSGEAGKRLLAHEVAHVLQQNGGGALAVQRREGKYPDRPGTPEYKGEKFPIPYTVLNPKKLNVTGPFSAAVLNLISSSYTDVPRTCVDVGHGSKNQLCVPARFGARYAQLVLTLLESSAEFIDIAAKLDAFYADDKNQGFRIFEPPDAAKAGSRFVGAGVPYRVGRTAKAYAEDVDVIMIDESVNPRMKVEDATAPDAQVAVAFVDALVHEAVHAFRRVSKLTKGGLRGSIAEELATRRKSSDILKEMSTASSKKSVTNELQGAITAIGADTLTLKEVALSLVSGDEITYLESHFVEGAFGEFFDKYSKSNPYLIPGLADLEPTLVTPGTVSAYATEVRALIEKYSGPRDVLLDRDVSLREEAAGVTPPPQARTLPAILTAPESARLLDLLGRTATLADFRKESKDVRKLSPAGRAIFFQVLLMKTSLIKENLKQEHQDAGFDATSPDHEKFSNELAKKFLGETKPYDTLK
jgi:hypothetical protein